MALYLAGYLHTWGPGGVVLLPIAFYSLWYVFGWMGCFDGD